MQQDPLDISDVGSVTHLVHSPYHNQHQYQHSSSEDSPLYHVPSFQSTQSSLDNSSRDPPLQNLHNLLAAGFINKEEYQLRKRQLTEEQTITHSNSTLTRSNSSLANSNSRSRHRKNTPTIPSPSESAASILDNAIPIIPRPPPNFTNIEAERATKYIYDTASGKWEEENIQVQLDEVCLQTALERPN